MNDLEHSVDDEHSDQTEKQCTGKSVLQIRPELESMFQWTEQRLLSDDQIGHTAEEREISGNGRQEGQV